MRPRTSKILFFLFAVGFLFVLLVYTRPFGQGSVARVAAVFPFPVATVNGRLVMYGRAFERYQGLQQFYTSEDNIAESDFTERLIASLVRERLIHQFAKQQQVFVTKEDREQILQQLIDQSGDQETLAQTVKEAYGWNLSEFERHVVKPFVETRVLEESLLRDRDVQSEKRAKIDEAYEKLQGGPSFDGLVLEYSEDVTSVFNGDMGWLDEDELPEAWKGPARHLEIGETSPVLEERDRFVILRVDNRIDVSRSSTGSVKDLDLEKTFRVNLSALIVNKISLSEAIQDFADQSNVRVWVKL